MESRGRGEEGSDNGEGSSLEEKDQEDSLTYLSVKPCKSGQKGRGCRVLGRPVLGDFQLGRCGGGVDNLVVVEHAEPRCAACYVYVYRK